MSTVQTAQSLTQASQALARGDLVSAEYLTAAVLSRSTDPDAMHMMALVRVRQNRMDEAITLFAQSLAVRPRQPRVLADFGRTLAQLGQHGHAVAALSDAVRFQPDFVDAWYELGNQHQLLGALPEAENCYRTILQLDPGNGLAKLTLSAVLINARRPQDAEALLTETLAQEYDPKLEIGLVQNLAIAQQFQGKKDEALANYGRMQTLDPANTDVAIARVNLLEDMERYPDMQAELESILARDPENAAVHNEYNHLLYRMGQDEKFLTSYDAAPQTTPLQMEKALFLLAAKRFDEAHAVYAGLWAREPDNHDAAAGAAAALDTLGRHDEAMQILEKASAREPENPRYNIALANSALQARDPQRAEAMAQRALKAAPHDQFGLALLGTAWRMMGDERDEGLMGYDDLIRVFDMEAPEGFSDMANFNAELVGYLETLHPKTREYLTQSLRGGTQTKNNLFGSGHDLIERLRRRIEESVERYITELKPDASHPFRNRRGNNFGFSGSWSSRLADCGFHVNHLHPMGWISSCYYAGVPDVVQDAKERQGWIKFGEPTWDVGLAEPIRKAVQPAPGRLVLFPSYMWHGTIPFRSAQTRTTIAFDAVPV